MRASGFDLLTLVRFCALFRHDLTVSARQTGNLETDEKSPDRPVGEEFSSSAGNEHRLLQQE